MNTSTSMDIKNKETTLNESIKDKNFNKKKSKIFIEVKENKNENKEKKNQIRDEGGGTAELLKKLENIDNTIIKRNKKFFKKLSMASFDKTEDKKEEYQKQEKEYQKVAPPGDVITSLTFGTYYTQSEESSVKSSKFSSKNNFALLAIFYIVIYF